MNFPSKLLEDAVHEVSKLPGIGKKTALRLVLHLLKSESKDSVLNVIIYQILKFVIYAPVIEEIKKSFVL